MTACRPRYRRAWPFLAVVAVAAAALLAASLDMGWSRLFASPDQRGRFLFERGRYAEAATSFRNPMWRGAALMRAGDFKTAADTFSGLDTAESAYDEGNARVMLGQYQPAIDRYDRALELRPDFPEAKANREIARLRLAAIDTGGADAGDQREGADKIVYDKNARKGEGQDTETAGAPMNDADIRALWLKRVETRPADFLRARFAAQLQAEPAAGAPP